MKRVIQLITFMALAGSSGLAMAIPLTLTNIGTVGGSTVFQADLAALGITTVDSITVVDSNSGLGGSPGIFSGFDLDALFLDADGDLTTSGDRTFASSFDFSAGTTRPTALTSMMPTADHPGPTFGSLDANTIDAATATLNVLDGVAVADVEFAAGFLTLGDGGTLTAEFLPGVPIVGSFYLAVGEVGTEAGEALDASVFVNEVQVPEPGALSLLAIGLLLMGVARRKRVV